MAGVSGIGGVGVGIQGAQIAAQLQVASLARTQDAIELQGDLALQLIESAAVITDPAVARNLDISA